VLCPRRRLSRFVAGCTRLRDRVLITLLNEAGLRIGDALGLRHEDIRTADAVVEVRARDNANGARAKTWGRQVPGRLGLVLAATRLTSTWPER
jgi:integrase/recombinase XerD